MKLKVSWGTGIVIAFIVFMTISLSTMFYFMSQDVHLVTDNYYEKELKYQQEIDNQQRTLELDEHVEINFSGTIISILIPERYADKKISGEIYFYRPSDPKQDFKIPLLLNNEGLQIIPVERIPKGFWRLKISWTMDGKGYYNERAITIE